MPATWRAYGVDANRDGIKDPYNPVDAIFAAARYLKAAHADTDLRAGIWAYNHADWYVDSVLLRARMIGGLPADFVGSLTGLTQARFPVDAASRYAGAIALEGRRVAEGNAALPVESVPERDYIDIFARKNAPVIAVNDGRIVDLGENETDGRFVTLTDVYGNTFTYSHLGEVSSTYPAPRDRTVTDEQVARELDLPGADPEPKAPASAGKHSSRPRPRSSATHRPSPSRSPSPSPRTACSPTRAARTPRPPAATCSWPTTTTSRAPTPRSSSTRPTTSLVRCASAPA